MPSLKLERFGIPPLPPSYLTRDRLGRRWREMAGRKLILVTAGAGFGKTSFLAARVRTEDRPCVWLTLYDTDTDPAAFFARLASIPCAPGLALLSPQELAGPRGSARFMERLLDIAPREGPGILFVLDDAQFVAGADEVLNFLQRWILLLPEGFSLVVASREPLGLPTARMRSHGTVGSFNARDLQFHEEEVAALFRIRFPGADLDRSLCRRIVTETEGWAAGIEILLQAAGGPSVRAVERALDQLSRAGSGWFSFFAEEVVSRLDPGSRDFLLKTSILPELNPATCDALLGTCRSADQLESLVQRNLFTFAAGDEPRTYRYHHLFREFLKDLLHRRIDPAEIQRLRLGAAGALSRDGAWAEAATAYAEAGKPEIALNLIEKYGDAFVSAGRYKAALRAFEGVPASSLRKRPVALSVLGRLQEIQGLWAEAETTYRAALRRSPTGALRVELLSLLAQIHLRRGQYARAVALCRTAYRASSPRMAKLRGSILCLLGLCAAELGRLSEAEKQFRSAHLLARKCRDPIGEGRALILLAINVHYFRGESQKAKDVARSALLIFRKEGNQRWISHSMGVLGFLAMTSAREMEARDLTEGALRLAEDLGYRMIEGYCRYTLGRCSLLSRDPAAAAQHFEVSRTIGQELQEPALLTLPRLGLAEVALAGGNRHAARSAALDVLHLAVSRKDRFQEAQCCILLGRIEAGSARRQRTKGSRSDWWPRAERILRSMKAALELHRLLLLRIESGTVPPRDLDRILRELLVGAASLEHTFLFLDMEPERACKVLPLALERGIETEYVSDLLIRLGPPAVERVQPLLAHPDEEVRARGIEVLARIGGDDALRALSRAADETTPAGREALKAARGLERTSGVPLKIRALGGLELSIGDEPVSRDRWRSARALRLFQFFLVHRFRWIPKDVVLESLWPEADPEKSELSLRQSVLLLRKSLEPDLKETRYSRYIHFRGDTYRLNPGQEHEYDVEAFEGLLDQGLRQLGEGRTRAAEARLLEAIRLYRGPFLAESPYEEFLASERERLNEKYLRAVDRLVDGYARNGRWDDAVSLSRRGLKHDPFKEDLHWQLVRAELALGHRREALDAYHHYEEIMRSELSLPPSVRMRDLARRIVISGGAPGAGCP